MDIFDVLTMLGGLCLFLFGMQIMGDALERRAGNSLRTLLRKLTSGRIAGLLTGLGVTAVIQSSSATTVMVVGFVNSGIMELKQAINVIMGANIGTTVTAWVLSLSGIEGSNVFVKLLKPTSFTPVLALIGIIYFVFLKDNKKKDTGMILLGFATLMYGMDTMSKAVSGLADVPAFQELFLLFRNPILGMLAGAVLTAIIQSSSASVGILQALASTGQVSYGAAIPIIMGQNIGTCITALLSSVGTTKNAKRAAMVHLMFNVIGTTVWLSVFSLLQAFLKPALLNLPAQEYGIAIAHSIFNILCTLLLLPQTALLEKLANKLVPDAQKPEEVAELDERLLTTPPLALERCRVLTGEMATAACRAIVGSLECLRSFRPELAEAVKEDEDKTDHYEDLLGSYLVKLSAQGISEADSAEAAGLIKLLGDFERIGDHAANILDSAVELQEKEITFSPSAMAELTVLTNAVTEIMDLAVSAYLNNDVEAATMIEPLEQTIDVLKEELRRRHIVRLQRGECSIVAGFIWSDLLTDIERTSDHCSNIGLSLIEMRHHNMDSHYTMHLVRDNNQAFIDNCKFYAEKYALPAEV